MGIKGFIFAIFLSSISQAALAGCESQVERATKRMFYDSAKTDSGQLDGLVMGSDKVGVVSYLESRGVSKIRVVPEEYFYATQSCVNELEKVAKDGFIYISGRNNQIVGKIQLENAHVSKVELANSFAAQVSPGMSRYELVTSLKQVLAFDKRMSVYPVPSCGRQCTFALRDVLGVGKAASSSAWKFVFPGGKKMYTIHFDRDVLIMASYERQRFAGDGVF